MRRMDLVKVSALFGLVVAWIILSSLKPAIGGAPDGTFYVATDGNDAWTGTLPARNRAGTDGPFATISAAREAARKLKQSWPTPRIRVLIRGGKYFLKETLILDERDSGTPRAPVEWAAFPGEHPVLSGGRRISDWKSYQGRILQADLGQLGVDLPQRPQLFFNGIRQTCARSPNRDASNPLYGGWAMMRCPVGPDGFKYDTGLIPAIARPSQSHIFTFVGPNGGFGSETLAVTSIDEKAHVIHVATQRGRDPLLGFSGNTRFFIENAIEALDDAGEWCVDTTSNRLYFWPPNAVGNETEIVVPVLPTLVAFSNTRWINLIGVTLTETAAGWQGAVRCENCDHLSFSNNRFVGLGGRGLEILGRGRAASYVTVERNEFADTGSCGVYFGGSVSDCTIADNDVHHCGIFDKYSAGIEFPFYGGTAGDVGPQAYTDRIRIAHNHVHDLPRDGIQLGANPYGRNVVEYNRVERASLETIDAGALRCHRVISHLQGVTHLPPMVGHVFHHNIVADTRGCGVSGGRIVTPYPWPTFGIYLDEGSSHCTVFANIVSRSGVGAIINPGELNSLENNVFTGNTIGIMYQAVPPLDHLQPPLGRNRLVHNIIVLPDGRGVDYSLRNWNTGTLTESDFNLFWSSAGDFHLESQPALAQPLKKQGFADWQQAGYDRHSRIADPLFLSPQNDDYRLSPSSPALKLGIVPVDLSNVEIGPRHDFKIEKHQR